MKKMNSIILLILILISSFTANATSSGGTGTTHCSASATLGASCEITCQGPLIAKCEGGFSTVKCECVSGTNVALGDRNKPNLTSQQLTDINSLKTYCSNYGTGSMSGLVTKITDVMTAYSTGTDAQFTAAEVAYFNYFTSTLSSTEKSDINTWVQNQGYPGF